MDTNSNSPHEGTGITPEESNGQTNSQSSIDDLATVAADSTPLYVTKLMTAL
jgi:hypothetical protein